MRKAALWMLLAMAGIAWGQAIAPKLEISNGCPWVAFADTSDSSQVCKEGTLPAASDYPLRVWRNSNSLCDATVEFHGKSKQVKDIFPEECGCKTNGHLRQCGDFKEVLRDAAMPPVLNIAVDRDFLGPIVIKDFTLCLPGHCDDDTPKSEPTDVRALQIGSEKCVRDPEQGWPLNWIPGTNACRPVAYACADKSRILLTAEDGKKWCHKPQP